jgi:hypothetical protein
MISPQPPGNGQYADAAMLGSDHRSFPKMFDLIR